MGTPLLLHEGLVENGKQVIFLQKSSKNQIKMSVPVTPVIPKDFSPEWAEFVLKDWFIKNERDVDKIKISRVEAILNGEQGLLSTTFIVDVFFQEEEGDEEKKSIFVKIPLIGEASKNFKQVNVREYEMFTNVLPELQKYLEETCDGFFCMGVPEVIYCYYSGDEVHDAFIIENLVETGFLTCTTKDLHVDNNGKDYLKSTLETLSQLHGTGLHFKKSLDGNKGVLDRFPKIEEQIQIKDILKNKESRTFLRQHFCAFIRYLEETDPELKNITAYMKKMETYLFKILKVLEDSGVRHLNTLCHGDAKPNNFMFRKIDIDFGDDDDEELQDLKCEGVESMLIDWQGGFLGSLCNDLMWCMFPFFEVNSHNKELSSMAFEHYYVELKNVLETFSTELKDFGLPDNKHEFRSLLRRGFVLEFLIVVILRPVLNMNNPEEVLQWYKKLLKYENAKQKGGLRGLVAGKKPPLPPQEAVFQNPRYMEFLQFYFKVGTALGAFEELGLIYFELMKDSMFGENKVEGYENDIPKKVKIFSKDWLKSKLQSTCFNSWVTNDAEYKVNAHWKESKEDRVETIDSDENPYEPVSHPDSLKEKTKEEEILTEHTVIEMKSQETTEIDVKQEEVETEPSHEPEKREPTPDPLRSLAAQLHSEFTNYRSQYNYFNNYMGTKFEATKDEELNTEQIEADSQKCDASISSQSIQEDVISSKEEISMVRKMSKECAWGHVVSEVLKDKQKTSRQTSNSISECETFKQYEGTGTKETEKCNQVTYVDQKIDTHYTEDQSLFTKHLQKMSHDIDESEKRVQETIEILSSSAT